MDQNCPLALLLEDEALIAMDVEQALDSAGFAVATMLTCADAEQWLEAHRPDVVIVDIMLKDGTCEAIVSRLVQDHVPFVVHSGDVPSLHANTLFSRGVWVSKPSDSRELAEAASGLILQTS
ncbi:response regulator [Devosia naphthalenivorans]|uniref:Response regulator n=2 Tax=Streptomyces xinghaiensis TaxID=1038928 RepID=A0A420UTH0_9ACTN|nr:response regulator [Devosia naphthalenivorans]RKM87750.1 response regulator [Streptomyces xinghaiensis]